MLQQHQNETIVLIPEPAPAAPSAVNVLETMPPLIFDAHDPDGMM